MIKKGVCVVAAEITGETAIADIPVVNAAYIAGCYAEIAGVEAKIAAQQHKQALFALNRQAGAMEGG